MANAGSLPEFTTCFDSASRCFSKGLGAPIGDTTVGSELFIKHARTIRNSIGEPLGKLQSLQRQPESQLRKASAQAPETREGNLKLAMFEPRRLGRRGRAMVTSWLDLEAAGCTIKEFIGIAGEEGLKTAGGRLAVHC